MNIFVLDSNPLKAAAAIDCVRVPKMVVESAQMMASAVRRWGATDDVMPLTKAGKPYKGGYHKHPCTIWAGDTFGNFAWLTDHAMALCVEYTSRFGKEHACADPISQLWHVGIDWVGDDNFKVTPFAQAMPDEFKHENAVTAYRAYYHSKVHSPGGVRYKHTSPPDWWRGAEVIA